MIKEVNSFPFQPEGDSKSLHFPIYFFDAYQQFIKSKSNQKIILLHQESLNAYAVFKIRHSKFWKFAQLTHAPLCNGLKLSVANEAIFFNDAIAYLKNNLKIDKIEQGDVLGYTNYKPSNSKFCEYGTYQLNLQNQNPESVLSNFNSKFARDVRHADKLGLEFKTGTEYLDDFYKVYQQTSKHTGMYTDSLDYFTSAIAIFTDKHCAFSVAYENNEPIGGLFMLKTPYKVCITHTGTNRNSKVHGAIRWLHYKNILESIYQNTKYYDFMGVRVNSKNNKLKGVFDFKKGFGGELDKGFLWKLPLRKMHLVPYNTYTKIRALINSTKHIDIIDQEN